MRLSALSLGTLIRFFSIALLIVGMVFYIHFQARNLIQGPTISLTDTTDSVLHERRITLNGTAKNIVKLTLNGKEIHTTEQGDFSYPLVLENGYTIIELHAEDRFGRKTLLTKEYVYTPLQG